MRRLLFVSVLLAACGSSHARTSPVIASSDTHIESSTPAPCTVWENQDDPTRAPADVAAPPERARRTLSGLRWCVMRPGEGNAHPTVHDRVTVHYTGWTTDGEMFDSSHTRGEPSTFPVDGVIAGWTEGLQRMSVGEVSRFWIPQSLAYGGAIGGPRGMLVFDVELIAIAP
jgi:FKBP-type peptidyl-prolyl cis-trans isomerase